MGRNERVTEMEVLTGSGHRREAARRLLSSRRANELQPEDLRQLIPDIWLYLDPPAGPHGPLSDDEWLDLFAATGFFVQGPPVVLHPEGCLLFRAAPTDRVRGMSWCAHQRMAEGFVPKHLRHGEYSVWSAAVPRTAILAVLWRATDGFPCPGGDLAREVVVDPAGLPEPVLVG